MFHNTKFKHTHTYIRIYIYTEACVEVVSGLIFVVGISSLLLDVDRMSSGEMDVVTIIARRSGLEEIYCVLGDSGVPRYVLSGMVTTESGFCDGNAVILEINVGMVLVMVVITFDVATVCLR